MGARRDPSVLDDIAIANATIQELRVAYVELRARHYDRVMDGLADRRSQDKKTGGDVPYGYRLDLDGETLIEDAAEQAVIAEAVRLREQEKMSFRRIARTLEKRGSKPRPVPDRKQRLKTKRPGEFDPTQIRRMILDARARAHINGS